VKAFWFIALAFMVGGFLPIQGGFNARMGQLLDHPLQASLVSFAVGTLFLAVCLWLPGIGLPGLSQLRGIPWYLLTGGFMGAVFVTLVLLLIPRVGVANVLVATMAGQLVVSMLLDHFGWLGAPAHPLGISRVLGGLCLMLGVVLIRY
jgi:transporter family-2 protein